MNKGDRGSGCLWIVRPDPILVYASIFIPLTFIAGIYGMNFEYMPELKWKWAYPVLWVAFVAIPVALLIYFKRKKWL